MNKFTSALYDQSDAQKRDETRVKADKHRMKIPEYLKLVACCNALGVDEDSKEARAVIKIIIGQRS